MRARQILVTVFFGVPLVSAPPALAQGPDSSLEQGQRMFEGNCSRCHGIGGTGGEGPSLARPFLTRARDDEALASLIRDGIPGTGMPGAWRMAAPEMAQLVAYVRSLGRTERAPLTGDPGVGRELFENKGGCLACHTVGGFGTSLGPDLSTVGARRPPAYLRESIVDPGAALPEGATVLTDGFDDFLPLRAVTRAGSVVSGVRVNEDTYTIQLRDATGRLHSLRKADLVELEKQFDRSLMPSYRSTFSDSELDHLVAYLVSLEAGL